MLERLIHACDVATISLPAEPNRGQALRGFSAFVGTARATAYPKFRPDYKLLNALNTGFQRDLMSIQRVNLIIRATCGTAIWDGAFCIAHA